MGQGRRAIAVLIACVAGLGATAPAATAKIFEGQLVAGSAGGYTDEWGGISGLRIGREAPPFVASAHAQWTSSAVPESTGVRAMAFEATGDLVVSTWTAIYRVDNETGSPTLLSGATRGTGPACDACTALVVAADGAIYATTSRSDPPQGTASTAAIAVPAATSAASEGSTSSPVVRTCNWTTAHDASGASMTKSGTPVRSRLTTGSGTSSGRASAV